MTVRPTWAVAGAALLLAAGSAWLLLREAPREPPSPSAREDFVGSGACASCHAEVFERWRGSDHASAMAEATEATVLGDFRDAAFSQDGVESRFFRREGKFLVRTDGPDEAPGEFEVRHTFGVDPLQQYLVGFPDGRVQALGIAWDIRARRWFHLYPDRNPRAGDPMHWTGIDQNWNYQCADCHSTNLRKNYDPRVDRFATTWSEISVGCEACHGPGARHLQWAEEETGGRASAIPGKGLLAPLEGRTSFTFASAVPSGNAVPSGPRASDREIGICARCHARRSQFSGEHVAGEPLHDAFRLSLLEPGLYHPDGQVREEVYEVGSFLQSKMYAQGVACSHCHDPHTGKLQVEGNGACASCHAPATYDAPDHHHHAPGSAGASCAACHMPTATYMVVDPRRDHSMRIPRPDRTVSLGVRNACNDCHADRSAQWAVDAVGRWYPGPKPGFQSFAEAFHAGERGAPGAREALVRVAEDGALPPFVRASAVARLAPFLSPSTLPAIRRSLGDPDSNVRMAGVGALAEADPATRLTLLPPLLVDPSRVVRMDAARALAGEPERSLVGADRDRFSRALEEWEAAQRFNADRPEAHSNLGSLHAARGRLEEAAAEYRKALSIDPTYFPAAVNLADLHRMTGNDAEAERTLRDALARSPDAASLHHSLGLALQRQGRKEEAIVALGEAASRTPEVARFAYVHAVALHDFGEPVAARNVLERALELHPYDRDILLALALYERAAGERSKAVGRARLLRDLDPENREFAALAQELGSGGR
ncbi:MAG: tetratricopeptide repeat protein [Planctomycetes bacterium]|nr:tetratricopeptide repeat protein [Planctomycetota bacterium]